MKENVLRTATIAGERVVQGFNASKEAVVDALEDGKKLVKRTQRTAEDLLDDASHNIRRFPFSSVAIAFGAGTMVGILVARNGRR
ncbi:MAG TPA: hypothetical protein VEU96_17960 [Bryobacteraceae bacterium]|nr:hypothetical protein [Bryobacteraceae bacterium]